MLYFREMIVVAATITVCEGMLTLLLSASAFKSSCTDEIEEALGAKIPENVMFGTWC